MLVDGGYDWVDVRDVAEGALNAAERAPKGARYLLGGRWASLREMARLVCDAAGRPVPSMTCPYWVARIGAPVSTLFSSLLAKEPLFTSYSLAALRGNRQISHKRAEREIGYRPRNLEETIRDTWRWFAQTGLVSSPLRNEA